MLKILDFSVEHIEQAIEIARANYESARRVIGILPADVALPDFSPLAENGLGVAAFDGGKMLGYLCCLGPFANAFGATDAIGVWSPLHANGLREGSGPKVFAEMYRAAAEKWVWQRATSHAITFYAYNDALRNQLFRCGFGLRCLDTIREMTEIGANAPVKYRITELGHDEFHLIFPIGLLLSRHLAESPMFMRYAEEKIEAGHEHQFAAWQIGEGYRYFAAWDGEKIIAYLKLHEEGENFIGEAEDFTHIHGAYCYPEYRGQGVVQDLLDFVIRTLRGEGQRRLGVDFESFNPAGSGFWLKYFTEYSHSVVRRVDDLWLTWG